ncbi:MAG: YIEGIA family protein [Bacillota bacterium]|nr:YIEGIA family protein [Bacillota bacterium]
MNEGHFLRIAAAVAVGTFARLVMLRSDYRQYPSYPHAYVVHLGLGFIAASLGALAVPAVVTRDFMAASILALAGQQFREVRDMERRSLEKLEDTELVPRGTAYIEGIARVFEARNYLAMAAALATSLVSYALPLPRSMAVAAGAACGLFVAAIIVGVFGRRVVGDIAVVRQGRIQFDGPLLSVEGIVLANIGLAEARRVIEAQGVGVVVEPRDDNARATLANVGQRQAIVHDAASIMGVRVDVSERDFTPLMRLDISTGRAGMIMVPVEPDVEALLEVVRRVPIIETSVRKPLATRAGRIAAD